MVLAIAYGAGSAALLALLVLILLGHRPEGAGRNVVFACAVTLLWTVSCAIDASSLVGITQILEDARSVAWLFFLGGLLGIATRPEGAPAARYIKPLVLALGVLAIGSDARFFGTAASLADFDLTQLVARVALAVAGILLVENIYRNTGEERRWHVVPLCIGLGAMFA
jgi:hypothetical protein